VPENNLQMSLSVIGNVISWVRPPAICLKRPEK